MTNDAIEKKMHLLAEDIFPGVSVVDSVMNRLSERDSKPKSSMNIWTGSIRRRWIGATAAAIIGVGLFFGTRLLPFGHDASIFGQVFTETLRKTIADGVTARETTLFVMKDGTRHTSSTRGKYFVSRNSYRRDQFEGTTLQSRQWYVPRGQGMVETGLRFDSRTYTVIEHRGSFGDIDPISRLKLLVGFVDKADKKLGAQTIDGVECLGFEISASKYGDNPKSWRDRIWFDVKTNLPVRVERERPRSKSNIKATIQVHDQFNWNPQLPHDAFSPVIPDGFAKQQ